MNSAIWVRESDVLTCSGEQAAWYLNGQLSVNVDSLEIGGTRRALLLEPDGSLVVPAGVTRKGEEEFALFAPGGCSVDAVARLERFKLRTKVDFKLSAGSVISFAHFEGTDGAGLRQEVRSLISDAVSADSFDLAGITIGELYSGFNRADIEALLGATGHLDVTDASRILAAQPEWGHEISGGMNPTELGEAFIRARADFQKGCYTGQELIERVDSRGYKTPRRFASFLVTGDPVALNEFSRGVVEEAGRPVFTVTSYSYFAARGCGIGLGFSHRAGGEFRSRVALDSVMVHALEIGELYGAVQSLG